MKKAGNLCRLHVRQVVHRLTPPETLRVGAVASRSSGRGGALTRPPSKHRFPGSQPPRATSFEMIEPVDPYNGVVILSSLFRAMLKVLGPVLLGFGTVFQAKSRPTDHWSISPQVTIQIAAPADESGDPPMPGCGGIELPESVAS